MKEFTMQEAKDRFLNATFEHMVEFGLENTSVRDLCKKTGVSPGKLYYWFESKEEIYIAALKKGISDAAGGLFKYVFETLSEPEKFLGGFLDEVDKYKASLRVSYQAATSPIYGDKLKEKTLGFNSVYERNIIKLAEILDCDAKEIAPIIYILISILSDYIVWEDRAMSEMQIKYVYKMLVYAKNNGKTEENNEF